VDARGSEYWTIIPRILGRSYREARTAALEMIQKAIDAGREPGEVHTEDSDER
jgi:hypothetical protein